MFPFWDARRLAANEILPGGFGLTGDAHRPAERQEADGHDPTPSDADGYARPRDTHTEAACPAKSDTATKSAAGTPTAEI